jgi:hypothetical protein
MTATARKPNALHCYAPPTERQQAEDALSPFDRDVLRVLRDERGIFRTLGLVPWTIVAVLHKVHERRGGGEVFHGAPLTVRRVRAALRRLEAKGLADRWEERGTANNYGWRATK